MKVCRSAIMAAAVGVAMTSASSILRSNLRNEVTGLRGNMKRVYVTNQCRVPVEIGEWGPPGAMVVVANSTRDLPTREDCKSGKGVCPGEVPYCGPSKRSTTIKNDGPCYEPNRIKWRPAEDRPAAFDYIETNGPFLGSNTTINNMPNFANWYGFNGIGISIVAYKPNTKEPACENAGGLFNPSLEDCSAAGGKAYNEGEVDKMKCQFPEPSPGSGIWLCGSPSSDYLKAHYFALQSTASGSIERLRRQFDCPFPHGTAEQRAQCYMEIGYWTEPTQPCYMAEPKQPDAARAGIGMWADLLYNNKDFDVEITLCPSSSAFLPASHTEYI